MSLLAITAADLKPVGSSSTEFALSFTVDGLPIGMRFNRVAGHVYGKRSNAEPWGFVDFAKTSDEAIGKFVSWVNQGYLLNKGSVS